MTRLGLALAAAAALIAAPHAALAQRTTGAPAAAPPPAAAGKVDPKALATQRERGKKEAPAVLATTPAAQTCQLTDALFKGQGEEKDAQGKSVGKISIYEVACQAGPGYLLIKRAASSQALNCIIAQSGQSKCELPQNTDFKAALAPQVQKAGRTCAISDIRYAGSTATDGGQDFYEIGCAPPQLGFLLGVSNTGAAPIVNDCIALLGGNQECKLTTRAQIVATFQPLVAKSGKACQVSDFRSIGRSKTSGETYTEIACGSTPGFVLVQDTGGGFKSAVDCAKAQTIGDGCKLTDVTVAKTEEAGTYTKLAAKAGFPCQVKEYRYIGQDPQNREVVEISCKDRTDGGLGLFSETGKSVVVDCVRAKGVGDTTCKLSDPSVVYPKYTAALAAKGRATCKVSGAQFLGRTQQGIDYVETACADGAPGWVIGFQEGAAAVVGDLLTCRQAANSGLPCKLPTNTAGNKAG